MYNKVSTAWVIEYSEYLNRTICTDYSNYYSRYMDARKVQDCIGNMVQYYMEYLEADDRIKRLLVITGDRDSTEQWYYHKDSNGQWELLRHDKH